MIRREVNQAGASVTGPASQEPRVLEARLFQLGLKSSRPESLANFYAQTLGYEFEGTDGGLMGRATHRRLVVVHGPDRQLDHAAYAVADDAELERLQRRLIAAGVPCGRLEFSGFEGEALRFADPDGNAFVFGVAPEGGEGVGAGAAVPPARLQHVVFASTQLERLLDFHASVVGFTLTDKVLDDEGGLRTAFLRCGAEHHSLALFAASESRLDHHCYEAGEWNLIRDWADHFARFRVPLKWGPGRHGPGNNLFLFIHDRDGNWLEISAELELVAPDRPVGEWPHEQHTLNQWGVGLLRS